MYIGVEYGVYLFRVDFTVIHMSGPMRDIAIPTIIYCCQSYILSDPSGGTKV